MACGLLLSVHLLVFLAAFVDSCTFDDECSSPYNYCCGGQCTNVYCPWTMNCFQDTDCNGAMRCCIDTGDCRFDLDDCPLSPGAVVGIVFGVLIAIGIAITIVSCCVCISCPLHPSRRRRQGGIITTQPNYQTIPNAFHQGAHPQPGHYPPQQPYYGGQPYQPQQTGYPPPYTV